MTTALIVEDDLRLRADLAFMLRDEGFEVTTLESAEEAFDRLGMEGPLPDLLLLDVRLPGESGVDLVRRLVEADRLPPTIVVSGEASIDETVEALKLGVHDFLEKPFHRQRLMRSIHNTMAHTVLQQRVARLESEIGVSASILGESGDRGRRRRPRVEPAVLERLAGWSWPGNVRELRSLAERLAVLAGDPIDLDQLPEPYRSGESALTPLVDFGQDTDVVGLREFRQRCEKQYIEAVLERTGWNVSEAARLLGIHRSRLHQKLKQLGTRRP
jgi:DNA-binding NtrC family response regulator